MFLMLNEWVVENFNVSIKANSFLSFHAIHSSHIAACVVSQRHISGKVPLCYCQDHQVIKLGCGATMWPYVHGSSQRHTAQLSYCDLQNI